MLSRNTTATFASYRLPTGGKQKRGRLSSDDAGWNGAENAGDDLGERFLSASTRAQERAPLNPCRAWQPKAGGMSEAVKMWLVAEYASVGGERRAEYKAFDSAKEAKHRKQKLIEADGFVWR